MTQKNSEPAKLISLLELFEGKKFKIPDYQRGYSWDEEQILDLLTDIEMHNSKSGHKHFTGTIVVERPNGGDVFQIVDGQQRLVSCVMIIRAIVEVDNSEWSGTESILIETPSGFEAAISLNEQDQEFFKLSILNQIELPIVTASNKRLQKCYAAIIKWLKEADRDIERIFKGVVTQLGFIFFETSSSRETTTMFEVINNRGKALSELDKFKNYFLHLCTQYEFYELEEDINSSWGELLSNLEKAGVDTIRKENQFVRIAFGVVFWKVKKDTDDVYKDFREEVYKQMRTDSNIPKESEIAIDKLKSVNDEIFLYFQFLYSSSEVYSYLFNRNGYFRDNGEDRYFGKLDVIFKKLRNHGSNGSVLPLFLVLMEFYIYYPQCRESIIDTLDVLEKLNFRFYCLPKIFYRSDTKRSYLFNLASDIYYGRNFDEQGNLVDETNMDLPQSPEYFVRIRKHLINLIDEYCPEAKFVEALTLDKNETYDFFTWRSLNFFLAIYEYSLRKTTEPDWNYETSLDEDGENKKMTKEHLLAVDNRDQFTEKDSVEKRRLGNYMLVDQTLNNQLGTKEIGKKIKIIEENIDVLDRLKHVDEVVKLYYQTTNSLLENGKKTKKKREQIIQALLDQRETNMINFALNEWRYPGEPKFRFEKVDTLQAEKDRRNERYYPDYDTFKR